MIDRYYEGETVYSFIGYSLKKCRVARRDDCANGIFYQLVDEEGGSFSKPGAYVFSTRFACAAYWAAYFWRICMNDQIERKVI